MEVSGAVLRPPLCCSGARPIKSVASAQSKAMLSWVAIKRDSEAKRFRDNSHLQFYRSPHSSPRPCRAEGMKQKECCSPLAGALKTEKKSKLLKGLEKDLSLFSGLCPSYGGVDQASAKIISEAAETLLAQLRLLREQERELKRMRKQAKKAKFSGTQAKEKDEEEKNQGVDCEEDSSSSSSESSSDSEGCDEAVDMRIEAAPSSLLLPISAPQPISLNDQIALKFDEEEGCCCTNGDVSTSIASPSSTTSLTKERIEVCMGNKCKKAGAEALMQEFGRRVGVIGAVVGCKCMGKCRDGPNVRVFHAPSSVSMAANNSLCIGVNPEDVDAILSNSLGDDRRVGQLAIA